MSEIICAIRGGLASQLTINQAIFIARETGSPLHFLYVVNLDSLTRTGPTQTQTISGELRQLGESILLTAQAKAEEQGVTAQGIVREGHIVSDEIIGLCRKLGADCVVLGCPQGTTEDDLFTHDSLHQFGQRVERETDVKTISIGGDKIYINRLD